MSCSCDWQELGTPPAAPPVARGGHCRRDGRGNWKILFDVAPQLEHLCSSERCGDLKASLREMCCCPTSSFHHKRPKLCESAAFLRDLREVSQKKPHKTTVSEPPGCSVQPTHSLPGLLFAVCCRQKPPSRQRSIYTAVKSAASRSNPTQLRRAAWENPQTYFWGKLSAVYYCH